MSTLLDRIALRARVPLSTVEPLQRPHLPVFRADTPEDWPEASEPTRAVGDPKATAAAAPGGTNVAAIASSPERLEQPPAHEPIATRPSAGRDSAGVAPHAEPPTRDEAEAAQPPVESANHAAKPALRQAAPVPAAVPIALNRDGPPPPGVAVPAPRSAAAPTRAIPSRSRARPAEVLPPQRERRGRPRAGADQAPVGPRHEITISIGHIEVRGAPEAPRPAPAARFRPKVTLDQFLGSREGGRR